MQVCFRGYTASTKDFIVFFCGMSVMVVELVGARMFVPFYGNTFFVWTSIIGMIMISLTLGYYRGGVEGDREGSFKGLSRIIFMAAVYTCLVPITVQFGGLLSGLSLRWGPLVGALVSLALPCFYLAKVSPYCIRLATKSVEEVGKTSGSTYAVSTAGSIFGTFLTGFVLIPHFKVSTIIYLTGALLVLISIVLDLKKKAIMGLLDFMTVAGIVMIQFFFLPTAAASTAPVNSTILFEGDTQYNSIAVFEIELNESESLRVLKLGTLIQGGVYTESKKSFYPYVPLLQLPWMYKQDIREVLILGNGAGIGITYLHDVYPHVNIDVVDIDPTVFDVAVTFFPEKEGPKVHFFADDARLYLKKTDKKYDLILMDVYSSTRQIPFHLLTDEMNALVEEHLTEDGMYMQEIVSAVEGSNAIVLKSILKTLDPRFGENIIVPVLNDTYRTQTTIVLSLRDEYTGSLDVEGVVAAAPESDRPFLNDSINRYVLNRLRVDYSNGIFLTDEYAPTELWESR